MLPSSSSGTDIPLSVSLPYLHWSPKKTLRRSLSSPMVSQRCISSDSSTYSSSSATEEWRGGAAEALADLAFLATRESETGLDCAGNWGSKGKRAMKRVKTECPANVDLSFNAVDSAPRWSTDYSEDHAVVDQLQCEDLRRNVVMKPIKGEQEADLLIPCSTSYSSFGGGKSRQSLTEAEKEARRICRILANRESARQTIRRRQALCEDLAKKVADLSWENENLKKEKDLALKEYRSLETTNRHLKERVAQAAKAEVEETQGDVPTSPSTNCNLPLYNRSPFTQLFWPAIVQPNTAQSQNGVQNTVCHQLNGPVSATCKTELSDKRENLVNINQSRAPLYLLPCPWFIPFPDRGNGLHPQPFFGVMNKQDENSASSENSASLKSVVNAEMNSPIFFIKARITDCGLIEGKPINDFDETLAGYNNRAHSREMLPESALCSSVQPALTDKHIDGAQLGFSVNGEAVSPPARQVVGTLSEQNQEQDMRHSKRLMDTVAAAEARRRRKELTKLKNLHGRQCRMHC